MQNNSNTLWNAYNKFILNIYGKRVPIPYRINIPPIEHPRRQGKSSTEDILDQLNMDAKEQNFDLETASNEEIKQFMKDNKLGIDCSGFVYRVLDELLHKTIGKSMTDLGFEHVGVTSVKALTSERFSKPIQKLNQIKMGDMIRLDSDQAIPHLLIIFEITHQKIIYAHSSEGSVGGVHIEEITIMNPLLGIEKQIWSEEYLLRNWSSEDGVKRLKAIK